MKIIRPMKIVLGGLVLWSGVGLFLAACSTAPTKPAKHMHSASATSAGKGAAQLWAENCVRCHNVRSPSIYSDAEWDVAMHHMRIRANLTAEDSTKILEFLKSAN
jgi:nitrate/TMAO reductase-like tetraheme cytochrome c subunit